MIEVRIHGRGGQGTVVASELLAAAFFEEGRFVQAFPTFGVERRGAPVAAFLRVDDSPIRLRCQIREPDHLIILDQTLVVVVDVCAGLKPGGWILINSDRDPSAFVPTLPETCRIAVVDAAGIAIKHGLGTRTNPLVNTAIIGAFARVTGLVSVDSILKAVEAGVPSHRAENLEAAREAFESVRRDTLEGVPG